MRKNQPLIFIILLTLSIISLAACSTSVSSGSSGPDDSGKGYEEEQGLEPNPADTINPEDGAGLETDQAEEENDPVANVEEQAEEKKPRYAVDPKNYHIYRVEKDEQDSGKQAEKEKIVLLTFDDTPTGDATYDILDTLDRYNAKAIFFVNGHYAERNLDTLQEIKERGHLIGNHTWWHIYIREEEPEKVRDEIVRLNDFIEEHLGERPKYFRPPFGQNSDVSLQIIREEGMQTMNWTNGSLDWELKSADAIVEQVLSNIRSGDNILFHDKRITAEALDPILKELTEQGYKFVLPTEVIVPELES